MAKDIEQIVAENKRLREALEKIIERILSGVYDATDVAFIDEQAKSALSHVPKIKNEEADWDIIWDDYSELIDNDIDSLQTVAGSCVITKKEFDKMKKSFTITANQINSK
jgi:hypothetical protein